MICTYIYFVGCNEYVKIGFSKRSPQYRISSFQCGNPYNLSLVMCLKLFETTRPAWSIASNIEHTIQKMCKSAHYKGEWYRKREVLAIMFNDFEKIEQLLNEQEQIYAFDVVTEIEETYEPDFINKGSVSQKDGVPRGLLYYLTRAM